MVPNEAHLYNGILQLLLRFQWTWVGIIASDSDKGERFIRTLTRAFSQSGICAAFAERVPTLHLSNGPGFLQQLLKTCLFLSVTNANVFVVRADTETLWVLKWLLDVAETADISIDRTWIMTAHWDFTSQAFSGPLETQAFHGALSFTIHSKEILGFQTFLRLLRAKWPKDDLTSFWKQKVTCFLQDFNVGQRPKGSCTEEKKGESPSGSDFERSMSGQSYSIYNAVYAIAHALHAMYTVRSRPRSMEDRDRRKSLNQQPWKVMMRSKQSPFISSTFYCPC